MKEELIQKILMIITDKNNLSKSDMASELEILFKDYDVNLKVTAVAIRNQDINMHYIQKFLIAKTVSGLSERTIKYYGIELKKIFERLNKNVTEVEADDIRFVMAIRQKRDMVSKTTANNELRVLKSFYTYLQKEELIIRNPCLKIDQIKQNKIQRKAFTEIEIEKLRNNCLSTRETAIVEILLSTGCRVSELIGIKREELDGEQIIVHGKGGKDRTVFLNAKALVALENYLKERTDNNPYIFAKCNLCVGHFKRKGIKHSEIKHWYRNPKLVHESEHSETGSIEALLRKLGKRAKVSKTYPHKFRRTCATLSLKRGMPIEQVSKLLGHEQISTTQIYLDLSNEDLMLAHKKYVI